MKKNANADSDCSCIQNTLSTIKTLSIQTELDTPSIDHGIQNVNQLENFHAYRAFWDGH